MTATAASQSESAIVAPSKRRVRIGHIWIDALTFAGALDQIERLVEAGKGGTVFTPNVDHVVQVEKNLTFRSAYADVDLSLVDGQPLVWASRLLGSPLPEKISGSDLILPVVQRAAERKWRVYLIGGPPGVAEEAANVMRQRFDVNIAGVDAPRVGADGVAVDEAAVLGRLQEAKPHIVLAAFGAPKQELFMHRIAERIRPAVSLGIGASLDFVAGRVKRAPRWMSKSGLEWLYRLSQEPRRLARRYLVEDPKFALILLRTMREPKSARVLSAPAKAAGAVQ
ncbi:MAG TPA: WecB/TagA/CpsF family glycosyltransferase [Polyangiaceae bacterium]|jgi:N-acetylglucosaminyldiphosphoundecaprenol N-acetyl-beta-D-mannosaminyltransferase